MTVKKQAEAIDGIIVINKPKGISSNQALQRVKHLFNAKKAGHTGSLDPMATGVLPICFGKATRVSQYLLNADKSYIAKIQLGVSTDTGDREGQVIATSAPPTNLTEKAIDKALRTFIGSGKQIPPMYSALKHQGKRLYSLAREGIEVDRPARDITLFSLKCLKYDPVCYTLDISVKCSKGTYIRVLGADIAKKLGYEGHLSCLHRTQCGEFLADDMHEISALAELPMVEAKKLIKSAESVFNNQPILKLSDDEIKHFYHTGRLVKRPSLNGIIRIYDQNNFVAIANFDNGVLIEKQLFTRQNKT